MQLRPLLIALACGGLAWGGYELSHVRADGSHRPFSDVLAAAGEEPAYLADASGAAGTGSYRISSLSVFSNVALHVKDNYVDPDRIDPQEMLVSALNEIERQIAEVMIEDIGGGKLRVRVVDEEKVLVIDDVASLWEINLKLREVFRFFEKHLPPQKDVRAIEYAAVNGALSTLDPHSVLLKPEAFQEMKTSTKGEFGGLGIVISVRDNRLTIISPLDDTPAARAGLKAGDVISRIGDVSTVSMAIEEAVRMLRGPEGSKVTIWVDRKAWTEPRKFSIVRERIKIESVESELLSDNVGYIKIKNFQQNTGKDLEEHLSKLAKKADGKLEGLVLDLRNNPGGLLEQAIRVSDKFLTSGDIVTTVGYGNKLREPKRARWSGTESTLPIAVLVNKGSASASEIVAGALKNLDRAVIIGETTFGKGSVQVLYDFADNSALKLTIAQYLTPGGISIQNEGVTPDVALTPAWIEEAGVRLYHRPEGHRENSLDKHLDRAGQDYVKEKPAFDLTFLNEREDDEDNKDPNAFDEDYEITIAKDFLRASGNASRSKTLQRAKTFFDARRAIEHDRIAKAIGELGVDWQDLTERDEEKAGLRAEVEIEIDGAASAQIQAGEEVSVTATVKNTSGVPLYQLRGVLDSEHPSFRGREFLFGYLEPGASRKWTVKTRIPKDTPPRSDLVALDLTSARGPLTEKVTMPVVTKYVDHPRFAYQFLYDDKARGDGDGRLEPGEGAEFVVLVTNLGPGAADEVSLRLKSGAKKNLFLERGRASIGKIAAGQTKPGRLKFRVPKGVEPGLDLPVELTIYDAGSGEWMEDEIRLQAAAAADDAITAVDKQGVVVKKATAAVATLQDLGQATAKEVAQLPKGAQLAVTGKTKSAYRVDLGEGMEAWVDAAAVRALRRLKAPKLENIAFQPQRRTPTIDLAEDPGGAVVNTESTVLAGTVRGDALRDMYVLLNDEKVFFKSGPPDAPGAAPSDEVKLPFSVKLPLEEGLNKVLVVARLDEKVVTYRSLFVSRRGAAVAEASPKKAD